MSVIDCTDMLSLDLVEHDEEPSALDFWIHATASANPTHLRKLYGSRHQRPTHQQSSLGHLLPQRMLRSPK
jgi:hypothetical protein